MATKKQREETAPGSKVVGIPDGGGANFTDATDDAAAYVTNRMPGARKAVAARRAAVPGPETEAYAAEVKDMGQRAPLIRKRAADQRARDARVGAGRGEVNPSYKAGGLVRRGYGKARGG